MMMNEKYTPNIMNLFVRLFKNNHIQINLMSIFLFIFHSCCSLVVVVVCVFFPIITGVHEFFLGIA